MLGQNLNAGGMGFLAATAIVLLAHAAIQGELPSSTTQVVAEARQVLDGGRTAATTADLNHGPAATMMAVVTNALFADYGARAIAVLAHLAVAIGLFFVGRNLFSYGHVGLAMATLYLLHPATAFDVGAATHVLPAALIVWAFVAYRKPLVSGCYWGWLVARCSFHCSCCRSGSRSTVGGGCGSPRH
ncbi:MAG: hypothetical protein R3B90_19475 [Planctomycetaceae bacterium]